MEQKKKGNVYSPTSGCYIMKALLANPPEGTSRSLADIAFDTDTLFRAFVACSHNLVVDPLSTKGNIAYIGSDNFLQRANEAIEVKQKSAERQKQYSEAVKQYDGQSLWKRKNSTVPKKPEIDNLIPSSLYCFGEDDPTNYAINTSKGLS